MDWDKAIKEVLSGVMMYGNGKPARGEVERIFRELKKRRDGARALQAFRKIKHGPKIELPRAKLDGEWMLYTDACAILGMKLTPFAQWVRTHRWERRRELPRTDSNRACRWLVRKQDVMRKLKDDTA